MDIGNLLSSLRDEAESTIRAFYALQAFAIMTMSQRCVDKFNENINFWNSFQSALLTEVFIGLRRLFGNEGDTLNFQKVSDFPQY